MTYLQLVLNPGQLSLQNLLLLLSVHLVQSDDGLGLEILTIHRSVQSSPVQDSSLTTNFSSASSLWRSLSLWDSGAFTSGPL